MPADVEVVAMQTMYDAIKDQPSDAQSRMLRWLTDRIEWDQQQRNETKKGRAGGSDAR